jgi:hypothetical protein
VEQNESLHAISLANQGTDPGIEAQKTLSNIELHLSKANDYYFKSMFNPAIDEYEEAEDLIYQLINASHSKDSRKRGKRTPRKSGNSIGDVYSAILEAALGLIESMYPKPVEPDFASPYSPNLNLPFEQNGVTYAIPEINEASILSQIADTYARRD